VTFEELERSYYELKGRRAAELISDEEFLAEVEKLSLQDSQGRWWTIGAKTGKWYVSQEEGWVEAEPPRVEAEPPPAEAEPARVEAVCPSCSAPLEEGAIFCGSCGARLEAEAPPAPPPPAARGGGGWAILGGIVVLIALAAGGVAVYDEVGRDGEWRERLFGGGEEERLVLAPTPTATAEPTTAVEGTPSPEATPRRTPTPVPPPVGHATPEEAIADGFAPGEYAGDCSSASLEQDINKVCSSLFGGSDSQRVYLVGITFSEFGEWVLLEQQSDWTWLVVDSASVVGDVTESPWPVAFELSFITHSDDFSDSSGGWLEGQWERSRLWIEGGEYHVLVKAANTGTHGWRKAEKFADLLFEADARQVSGPNSNAYGLVFRYEDEDNFYRFVITGEGKYRIRKQLEGEWVSIKGWTRSEAINQGVATNYLKVICQGDTIEVYVNTRHLATVTDPSFAEGYIALTASAYDEPNVHVAFDNVNIWETVP
jgi:hypothetical protein